MSARLGGGSERRAPVEGAFSLVRESAPGEVVVTREVVETAVSWADGEEGFD
jgi:hypothetical protein